MNYKSFFLGILVGVVLSILGAIVIDSSSDASEEVDPIHYLEKPMNYENKEETSFKVFQASGNVALANEVSDERLNMYLGKTVLIIGEDFYNDQVITIKTPMRIGSYEYTTQSGRPMTVPVIDGSSIE